MLMRGVIFDIGGVLEITPETGWQRKWAHRLGISAAALEGRLEPIWAPGTTGEATLEEIEHRTRVALGLDAAQLTALMTDAWDEYLGTLNAEMASYFAALRPASMRSRVSVSAWRPKRPCSSTTRRPAWTERLAVGMTAVRFVDSAQTIAELTRRGCWAPTLPDVRARAPRPVTLSRCRVRIGRLNTVDREKPTCPIST